MCGLERYELHRATAPDDAAGWRRDLQARASELCERLRDAPPPPAAATAPRAWAAAQLRVALGAGAIALRLLGPNEAQRALVPTMGRVAAALAPPERDAKRARGNDDAAAAGPSVRAVRALLEAVSALEHDAHLEELALRCGTLAALVCHPAATTEAQPSALPTMRGCPEALAVAALPSAPTPRRWPPPPRRRIRRRRASRSRSPARRSSSRSPGCTPRALRTPPLTAATATAPPPAA